MCAIETITGGGKVWPIYRYCLLTPSASKREWGPFSLLDIDRNIHVVSLETKEKLALEGRYTAGTAREQKGILEPVKHRCGFLHEQDSIGKLARPCPVMAFIASALLTEIARMSP